MEDYQKPATGKKERVSIIILAVLFAFALTGAMAGLYFFQQEKCKLIAARQDLESIKLHKRIVESKLIKTREEINQLETQLQTARSEMSQLSSKLGEVNNQKQDLLSQVEKLQVQVRELEGSRQQWEAKEVQAQEQIDKLRAQLEKFQTGEADSGQPLNQQEAQAEVPLGKIIVEQEGMLQLEPIEGLLQIQGPPVLEGITGQGATSQESEDKGDKASTE